MIIGTFLLGGYEVRRAFTVRLIVYFSIADFIGNLPGLGSMPFTYEAPPWQQLPHWMCIINGIGNWGTAQAGWFWTMAYAYVRRRAACPPPACPLAHTALSHAGGTLMHRRDHADEPRERVAVRHQRAVVSRDLLGRADHLDGGRAAHRPPRARHGDDVRHQRALLGLSLIHI